MSVFSFSSLRVRLLLLVLVAFIPAFGLIGYTAWEQRQSAASDAKAKALKVARNAVEEQRQLIADARQLLGSLAREPEVISAERADCPTFLADQLKQHRRYRNLGVIGLDGTLRCGAVPSEDPINFRDRLYFQKAVETRDFSVGDYQLGRVTGKATVAFSYPVLDDGGNLRGVAFTASDLEWLNRLLSQSELSPGSALMVVDQNGTVLAHSADPQIWVGKSLPQAPIVRVILSEQGEGTIEAAGVDGVDRLYAFTSLPVSIDSKTYIGVGIPTRVAYADAHRILLRNLLFIGLVAILVLVAVWFGGDLFVLRQVNALLEGTKRFASGDLYGRTRLTYATRELAQLAQSFDAMGVALHAREVEIRISKEEVQHHLERIRALHEINLAINSTLDLRTVSDILLEKIYYFFSYPTVATIRLLNKTTGQLEPLTCWNLDESEWKTEDENSGGLTEVVAETKRHLAVEEIDIDFRTQDREFFRRHNLFSYLGVPLVAKGELLGVISIYSKEKHRFTGEEIEFLTTLGGQAAIAIDNSRLYEETRKRAVESDAANKLKGEFLSVMSHELRTPLSVAMGYAGMIKERVLGEINSRQEEALDKVLRQGHDQLYMINSILYAASIHADAVKVDRNDVKVNEILDDLKSTYAVILEKKKITLAWDYLPELPVIRTDVRKLRHILENLINNAIKFTDSGSVTVSVRCLPDAKVVQFKVADTGPGISKDSLRVVFEMFQQGEGVERRLHGGVGLGLYIVKKFTELLGGTVAVESEFGKGSTFTITMPYQEAEQTAPKTQSSSSITRAA